MKHLYLLLIYIALHDQLFVGEMVFHLSHLRNTTHILFLIKNTYIIQQSVENVGGPKNSYN